MRDKGTNLVALQKKYGNGRSRAEELSKKGPSKPKSAGFSGMRTGTNGKAEIWENGKLVGMQG